MASITGFAESSGRTISVRAMPPPARSGWRRDPRRSASRSTGRDAVRFVDLLMEPRDESLGDGGPISAGAKRVAPLPIGELLQKAGGEGDVLRRDLTKQLLMAAVIVETDEAVLDVQDEGTAIEEVGVRARRHEAPSLAECGAQIANHVPAFGSVARLRHLIQGVVDVLEVRAVEDREDDEQASIRARADERILLP